MGNKIPGNVAHVGPSKLVKAGRAVAMGKPHMGKTILGTGVRIQHDPVSPHLRRVKGQWG
jgi:hypothetical protein